MGTGNGKKMEEIQELREGRSRRNR